MNVVFTQEDFNKYNEMVKQDLSFYQKYLKPGARILDIGCGLGCTAVPLSALGYEVVGIDNDKKVVEAAQENAKNFGRKMDVVYGDIFEIDKKFGKDSFDACISGGVLEHFPQEQIREIMDKQLHVAPLVIAGIPIATKEDVKDEYKDYEKRICLDGIYRNMWTPDHWINQVFKDYNILEHRVGKASEAIGGFNEIFVVMGRKK
ncbi:class I SAM-dependent methyltransferase [Candidatus Woesearchaeota archaeon]|nr:class I SAM-dependent methyltransferase [Candidatus Woesearchaeota archaeon]